MEGLLSIALINPVENFMVVVDVRSNLINGLLLDESPVNRGSLG
ncbi:MAG: hypothetical protein QXO48_06850 [Desulfurococcaceae archaeon]